MRRRAAFTLVEMMVSVALVLFIMVILTEAFGKGLESFRTLKAIGDMESRLRAATAVLRRDLEADHFEARRRLSEDSFTWKLNGAPREGQFTLMRRPGVAASQAEGNDSDGVPFQRSAAWLLHFTSKARGNNRSEFYTATVPVNSPLTRTNPAPLRTTFFDQPADARFQDQPSLNASVYSSQWAELAYFLEPSGQTPGEGATLPTPLYTLYRCQYVMVTDNSQLNWVRQGQPYPIPVNQLNWPITNPNFPGYIEMSCYVAPRAVGGSTLSQPATAHLYFCTPGDAATPRVLFSPTTVTGNGAFDWPNRARAAMPILTEVISFDVSLLVVQAGNLVEVSPNWASSLDRSLPIHAIKITMRVYEPKTKQTRQTTLVQDL